MAALRSAFARCCKLLGLDQDTCVALLLLLKSREALTTMLSVFLEIENRNLIGQIPDMTTLIVNIAESVIEKERLSSTLY